MVNKDKVYFTRSLAPGVSQREALWSTSPQIEGDMGMAFFFLISTVCFFPLGGMYEKMPWLPKIFMPV